MWTEKTRSWRRKNKRGVSPIIATILLVAITVVLAAVLYILISGFTKGPGNTPLGTAFTFGSVSQTTSGSAPAGTCAANHWCYNLLIGSAGGGITASSLNFALRDVNGNPVSFGGTPSVHLVSVSGTTLGVYNFTGNSWSSGGSTGLSTTQSLVLDLGCTTGACSPVPTGDIVVALGVGSYSGQVTATMD